MVEGPGCKVKGEVMRKRIVGKTVVSVKAPMKCQKAGESPNSRFLSLEGLKVSVVRTIGKELFIFLAGASLCVRIHFLMDGSVRYGGSNDKKGSEPSIEITFNDEKMVVFKSSIDLRSADESNQHCDDYEDLDICSPIFNFRRAQEKIEEKQSELICDVIMDQSVLPGVGNIIKNEGLFKSGINPNTVVRDLSSALITCLIHRLRDFSAIFYMCRKKNKPLKCHLCVYEKSACSQCKMQVTVCKPGSLGRLTFYCSVCQVNSNLKTTMSLPKKNSLLGFLKLPDESRPQNDSWECSQCTFINSSPSLACLMCFSQSTDCKKRKLSDDGPQHPPAKKGRSELQPHSGRGSSGAPECPGHAKICAVRTVTRPGENKGRSFYCCSIQGNKQCKFFQWADLHHPMCQHGKRTLIRRVLKQNSNNGREFYCCPLKKSEQCGFFQWVEES